MAKPPVLVLFNKPVLPADHPEAGSECDIIDTVADTINILKSTFDLRQIGIDHDPRPLLDELRDNPPVAVFNLFEGIATQPNTEVSVAALLEWLNIPFTGSPSPALALGRDKIRVKQLLASAKIGTPPFIVVEDKQLPPWRGGWPAIVKPALQDASIGIDQASVVTNRKQLAARVEYLFAQFGPPVLIERFVSGREFLVHVYEDGPNREIKVLPASEIAYSADRADMWPLYTFTAKWQEESQEYKAAPVIAPVMLPPEMTTPLNLLAARAFRLLGCRDYARLDVRQDAKGNFFVLEVNPNPYLNSIALSKGLEAVGLTHDWFVTNLVRNAMIRGGNSPAERLTDQTSEPAG